MSEFQFEVKNDPEIYEELYFKDGYRTVWEFSKKALIAFLVFLAVTAVAFAVAYNQNMTNQSMVILGIAFVGLMITFFRFMSKVGKYRQWRAPIDAYINDITRYKSYWMVLTPQAIELKLDGVSYIEKVEEITHSTIDHEYVAFGNAQSPTKYLIPKKSVRQNEYERIKTFLKDVLKQGVAEPGKP